MEINRLLNKLENDGFMPSFRLLYGFDEKILLRQKKRYIEAVKRFSDIFPEIRLACSDRAVLRAAHFFSENRRAQDEAAALMNGDFDRFLEIVRESGDSSANLLQNLYSVSKPANQEIPLAIMASKRILKGRGAVRVHGGGFAGTIQAFVPLDAADEYIAEMDRIFGVGSCLKLRIRPVGGIEITGESEVS